MTRSLLSTYLLRTPIFAGANAERGGSTSPEVSESDNPVRGQARSGIIVLTDTS